MKRRLWLGLAIGLLAALGCMEPGRADVPAGRLRLLARGTNVTLWFRTFGPQPEEHYRSYMSDGEMAAIRRLGLRHVRLCISPDYLYDPSAPDQPNPAHLALVEDAIRRFHAHDLAVVVDPHNENQQRLESDARWSGGYPAFWGALAAKLRHFSPERTFFEVVNEPDFNHREAEWTARQQQIVAAIRRSAPRHTIIATGPNWGGVDGLRKLAPLADRNVVYSFHFYDPFPFTHQGATWSSAFLPHLKGIPYPSSPEAVAGPLARMTDPEARRQVERYGAERWDRERLKRRLSAALDWGREHHAPLYCGEFGVYPVNAPPDSRRNWFRDYAAVLRESGVGYAVWGWDDAFGFRRELRDGKPVVDPVPVEALGLKQP